MKIADGRPLNVLDIVDVPVTKCAKDVVHPEDWVVDTQEKWTRAGALDSKTLGAFEEKPKDLWLDPGHKSDRVTGAFLLRRTKHQSLYLIRPENFRVELSVTQYSGDPNPSTKKLSQLP